MRAPARIVTVLGVAAAALAGIGLGLGMFEKRAESVDAPGLDALFPSYPGARMYGMGDSLSMNGVPVRMGYFSTDAKPNDVATYFTEFWSKHQLPTSVTLADAHAEASAYDAAAGAMRTISAVKRDGHVVAFASIVPMDGIPTPVSASEIPLPDGAAMVQRTASNEGGRRNQSVAFVLKGQLGQEKAALEKTFTGQGWKVVRELPQPDLDGLSVRFTKDDRRALATLVADPHTGVVGVEVHVTGADEGSPP